MLILSVIYRMLNAMKLLIQKNIYTKIFIQKEYNYCRKVMNKHCNKNLIMKEKGEHLFQQSNGCWICKKLFHNDEEKIRDHCCIADKFRGAAH